MNIYRIHQNVEKFSQEIKAFKPSEFFDLPNDMFDSVGNLAYCNIEPLQLERGNYPYYTPYLGWIRYGLNVNKFGYSGQEWLESNGQVGEWAVAFHGLRRDVKGAVKGIALNGFKAFKGNNSQWGSGSPDVGKNKNLFRDKNCGTGVFCSPQIEHLTYNSETCLLIKPLKYTENLYVNVIIQSRVRPRSIRIPSCSNNEYYIINKPNDIRPYGICINFIPKAEAESILKTNRFNLAAIEEITS